MPAMTPHIHDIVRLARPRWRYKCKGCRKVYAKRRRANDHARTRGGKELLI